MSLGSFVQSLLPWAQNASAATGLPTDFILSQWALETGSGTSPAFLSGNNVGGIGPGTPNYYPSLDAGVNAYVTTINSPRYAGANSVGSPLAIGDYLNGAGYSTTPDYGSRVNTLLPQVDNVLASLGVSQGAFGVTGSGDSFDQALAYAAAGQGASNPGGTVGLGQAGNGSGTASPTGAICASFFSTPVACIQAGASYVGYIILAIAVLGVGIWAVARKAS